MNFQSYGDSYGTFEDGTDSKGCEFYERVYRAWKCQKMSSWNRETRSETLNGAHALWTAVQGTVITKFTLV